jgi:hypothetical protein
VLVATKQREKDESEYQWGMTKAQLAVAESDRSSLQVCGSAGGCVAHGGGAAGARPCPLTRPRSLALTGGAAAAACCGLTDEIYTGEAGQAGLSPHRAWRACGARGAAGGVARCRRGASGPAPRPTATRGGDSVRQRAAGRPLCQSRHTHATFVNSSCYRSVGKIDRVSIHLCASWPRGCRGELARDSSSDVGP